MTLKQLGCFLIVLIASEGLIAQSSPSWLHLRCEEDRYGLRKHSDSDQFRNDIVLRDRAVFVVSLTKSTFEGVKKWDSNVRSLPISHNDARTKLKGSQSKLFRKERKWQLEEVILYSVSEEAGDHVWVGVFVEVTEGGYSFVPTIFVYLNMDGEILIPKSLKGKEAEFSKIFNESLNQKAE